MITKAKFKQWLLSKGDEEVIHTAEYCTFEQYLMETYQVPQARVGYEDSTIFSCKIRHYCDGIKYSKNYPWVRQMIKQLDLKRFNNKTLRDQNHLFAREVKEVVKQVIPLSTS